MNLFHVIVAGLLVYAGVQAEWFEREELHHIGTWKGEANGKELMVSVHRNLGSTQRWRDVMMIQIGENGDPIRKLGRWSLKTFVGSPTGLMPTALVGGGPLFEQGDYTMECRNLICYGIPDGTRLWLESSAKITRNP